MTRALLTTIARAALDAVEPRAAVARVLRETPIAGPVEVLALGKASVRMTRAVVDACDVRSGLVVAPRGSPDDALPSTIDVRFGDHPIPDDAAAERGEALLSRAAQVAPGHHVVVLLSGGGSALADAPVIPMAELRALTTALLRAGASIDELNTVRASLSRLKAGGLARALGATPRTTIVISDVPSLPASFVASGPMTPLAPELLAEVLSRPHVARAVPASIAARARLEGGPASPLVVAADNELAVDAALAAAASLGLPAVRGSPLVGEARERGAALAAETRTTEADALICGGETTVTVRGEGRGGRSHELALGALEAGIGGELLAFGTDGVDGTSDAAGAFVDDEVRTAASPRLVADAFARSDTHALFASLHAQLVTGPTGTNVADLAIWLR